MSYGSSRPKKYKLVRPDKYIGDVNNVIYRSSWEKMFMGFLENSTEIKKWSSECFCVEYVSPKDNKTHRYFPDFILETVSGKKMVIEIKPYAMSVRPKSEANQLLVVEYAVNCAKWDACRRLCKPQGFEFQVLTEYELGLKER